MHESEPPRRLWGLWVHAIDVYDDLFVVTGKSTAGEHVRVEVPFLIPHPDLADMVRSPHPVLVVTDRSTRRVAEIRLGSDA